MAWAEARADAGTVDITTAVRPLSRWVPARQSLSSATDREQVSMPGFRAEMRHTYPPARCSPPGLQHRAGPERDVLGTTQSVLITNGVHTHSAGECFGGRMFHLRSLLVTVIASLADAGARAKATTTFARCASVLRGDAR